MLDRLLENRKLSFDEIYNIEREITKLMDTDFERLISYYNRMSKEQIMNVFCDYNGRNISLHLIINQKVIASIDDKTKLFIPYSSGITFNLKKLDKESQRFLLSSEIFYSKIESHEVENILDSLDSDLVTYFINNLIKYKPNEFSGFLKHATFSKRAGDLIKKYITDEEIIAFMQTCEYSDQMVSAFCALQSENAKNEVFKSEWFKSKVDITKNSEIMESATEYILDEFMKVKDISYDYLTSIFIRSKNIVLLNKYIELINEKDFNNNDRIIGYIFALSESKFSEVKNKDRLYELINSMEDSKFINEYFEKYVEYENQSKELKSFLYNKVKNILSQKNVTISKLSKYILESNNTELFELIVANISKEDLLMLSVRYEAFNNYVINLLQSNPNYFDNITINNNNKYACPELTIEQLKKYQNIAPYLNEELLSIYYIPMYIENFENIKIKYIDSLKSNPNKIFSLSDIQYLSPELSKYIFTNISIDRFMYLCYKTNYRIQKDQIEIIQSVMHDRIMEIVDYFNEFKHLSLGMIPSYKTIFRFLKTEDYSIFIKSLLDNTIIEILSVETLGNESLNKLIINYIIDECNNDNYDVMCLDIKLLEKYQDYINFDVVLSKALLEFKYTDSNNSDNNELMKMILKRIDENINVLFDINIICKLDEILVYLPTEYKKRITNYIDEKYNILKTKYPMIEKYITNYTDKANYVLSVENNYINNNNINRVMELLDKNRYLFGSMDFRLLIENISKLGDYFVDKASRHTKIASKAYKIYEQDKNNFELLVNLSNKMRKENNDLLYDKKIEIVIDYLIKNSISVSEINDNILTNIESYILEQSILKEQNNTITNIGNFIEEKNKLLDEKIKNCDDLTKLKDFVNRKYFGLNTRFVNQFLQNYAKNYNLVSSYSSSDLPIEYIKLIEKINTIQSIEELKEIASNLSVLTISHNLIITSIMIDAYNKAICNEINKDYSNKNRIIIDGIGAYDCTSDFGLFVHSTDAYGSMTLINDDYYESWNYNPNTKNHGICTSYITNSSYGTAAVHGNGVMFGFYNLEDNAIPIMAPYDLGTANEGYTITSFKKPFFTNLKGMADYTRHTHNEASLERRKFIDGKFVMRQPDCIIVFEDMDEKVKQNSIKAYNDFKKHGYELKLIYIDRVKNAQMESEKLANYINEYEKTHNLDILKEIINKYESNICGSDFLGMGKKESINLYNQHELFMTQKIKQILDDTISYIKEIGNIELANQFKSIIDNEQSKFDLINEGNSNRMHKFTLNDEALKAKISSLFTVASENKVIVSV